MKLNRLTLSFTGIHEHLEPAFLHHYFHNTISQIRIALIAGLIFYGGFGALDTLIMPDHYPTFWFIRWAVVCPCLLGIFAYSYTDHAHRHLQMVNCFGTLICGFGIIAMAQIAASQSNHAYSGGLVHIIFYIFTFARLRFVWGASAACLLVAACLTALTFGDAPKNAIVGKGFHLSVICLMGMMAGYAIEYQARKNFFLSRQLKSKKRRLAIAKNFLEERVARRTAELNATNTLLKGEISERKLIESALRDSQKRFRRMVDNVSDHMCVYDLEGNIHEANRQMISGLGYTFEKLAGMTYADLIVPEERADHYQYMTDIRRKGTATGTITLMTRKGEPRYFEYSNVLGKHTTDCQAIFSLARDVTHRRRTEKALADSQMRFRNIFDTAAAGMAIIAGQTARVVEINRAGAQMAKLEIDSIKGRQIDQLITMPKDGTAQQLPVPTPHPIECMLENTSGDNLPILVSTQNIVLDDRPLMESISSLAIWAPARLISTTLAV